MSLHATIQSGLAIVAGGGAFPDILAREAAARGRQVFAVRLIGHVDTDTLKDYEGINVRAEQMGLIFDTLRKRGIRDVVLIGRMQRPKFFSLRPDFKTLCVLPRLLPYLFFKGDDALLKAVRRCLEGEGFSLFGAQDFIVSGLAHAGCMGLIEMPNGYEHTVSVGVEAARDHGRRDQGQAVIVKDGVVVGLEGRDGTDAMISRYGAEGAVLVKMAKPQQDRALDMPSIGPDTVRLCGQKRMAGIAVEAGATLMADKKSIIALADQTGLFLVGVS